MDVVKTLEVYKASDGWRWRAIAGNNKIVAEGGEAYNNRGDCLNMAVRVVRSWENLQVEGINFDEEWT